MKVKELKRFCDAEVRDGNGDRDVFISADDEGNGFHPLFYSFTSDKESIDAFIEMGCFGIEDVDADKIIILG